MQIEIERFPYGMAEGAPCMAIRANVGVKPDQLAALVHHNMRDGLQVLWIQEAPWGDQDWDQALHRTLADPRLQQVGIAAIRSLEAERWSNIEINWTGDISAMLAEPVTAQAVKEVLLRIQYHPRLTELLLVRPALANIRPAYLDDIYTSLDPVQAGFIYAPPGDTAYLETALVALTRCATPWALRVDRARGDDDAAGG